MAMPSGREVILEIMGPGDPLGAVAEARVFDRTALEGARILTQRLAERTHELVHRHARHPRRLLWRADAKAHGQWKIGRGPRPGHAENSESFRARPGVGVYFADSTSLGMLLDVGGRDEYWGDLGNDMIRLDEPDSPNWADRNFGVFVDRSDGVVDLTPEPTRRPSAPPCSPMSPAASTAPR